MFLINGDKNYRSLIVIRTPIHVVKHTGNRVRQETKLPQSNKLISVTRKALHFIWALDPDRAQQALSTSYAPSTVKRDSGTR
ncbi:hypothetical protein MSTE_03404 [Mycobacteroides stephanolepidis]|uniref:Transposase n=1 Tax=[Mycobacterium] stephanolepidis TaxID=1520670 RepID=A0A1Z4F0E6_9MYCO|nr:hypothetical protein MSTE_03404 [[Mycobacterium] stephanolepidis]